MKVKRRCGGLEDNKMTRDQESDEIMRLAAAYGRTAYGASFVLRGRSLEDFQNWLTKDLRFQREQRECDRKAEKTMVRSLLSIFRVVTSPTRKGQWAALPRTMTTRREALAFIQSRKSVGQFLASQKAKRDCADRCERAVRRTWASAL